MSLYKTGANTDLVVGATDPKAALQKQPITRESIRPGIAAMGATALIFLGIYVIGRGQRREGSSRRNGPDLSDIEAKMRNRYTHPQYRRKP